MCIPSLNEKFWRNKNVLITGHTGFKGGWLSILLSRLGTNLYGIGLPPNTNPSLSNSIANLTISSHLLDIRNFNSLSRLIAEINPEIVFHLAAQPLVRQGYESPLLTFETNVMGTVNLLNALRNSTAVKAIVCVTTDKVYENNNEIHHFTEDDRLGGQDPYSASKSASEMVVNSYFHSFFKSRNVSIATARAGNVIGGGDWSENRLIPDAIRAWNFKKTLHIRNPSSVRPWQHVLEPLHGYLKIAEKIYSDINLCGAYNLGPDIHEISSVDKVISLAANFYGNASAQVSPENDILKTEANFLSLSNLKAANILKVFPRWSLEQTIEKTVSWYKNFYLDHDAISLCNNDIDSYYELISYNPRGANE